MDTISSLTQPVPLHRSIYVRPPAYYYISAESTGQCQKDLYELARSTGAFSESQIGEIAYQLLTQLKELHALSLNLLLLTPQNILVRSESKTSADPIIVDIVDVIPMLMTCMKNPDGFSFVSGVDRLFLAPELNLSDKGPQNDVWSLGVILYLMITGGRSGKRTTERLTFNEEVWNTVSGNLKIFVMDMLQVEASQRTGVNDLLQHEFLQDYANEKLDGSKIEETNLDTSGANLLQF